MEASVSTTSSTGVARWGMIGLTGLILTFADADAQQQPQTSPPNPYLMGTEGYNKGPRGLTSYQPVAIDQTFSAVMAHDLAAKPGIDREHQAMLEERYDLSDRPAQGITMERGKALQEGVRVKLPSGVTWEQLAAMSADEIRERGLWPKGFLPLPHPFHPTGGQVFPKEEIDAIKMQDGRDLTRFDVDFDLPERFLAPFPPAMYLTPRPRSRRRLTGQAGLANQLLRAVQRHSHAQATGRVAPVADAFPGAAIQCDRRSQISDAQPRRRLLRLPFERSSEWRPTPHA
jgi:hypothetical protein